METEIFGQKKCSTSIFFVGGIQCIWLEKIQLFVNTPRMIKLVYTFGYRNYLFTLSMTTYKPVNFRYANTPPPPFKEHL